jgi:hypothetical protein
MKKIVSLFLIFILSVSLFSCGEKNRTYDEAEVMAEAKELIRKSAPLNEIFWGEGIGYMEDDSYRNGNYFSASPADLEKYGVFSVDDIKEKTKRVFSEDYSENIFSSVFSSYSDDEYIMGYTRYYQEIDILMVYSLANILLTDDVEYLFDTLKVKGSVKETVYVELSVKITRDEKSQVRVLSVGLVEEEDGWRIDTPTYMSYREDYEEQKQD